MGLLKNGRDICADQHPRALAILGDARPAPPRDGIYISEHPDELVSVADVFDGGASPEDYISGFGRYVRENSNAVPGLIAAIQRPRELTRKELKELATLLDAKGFSEAKLRRAYGQARNADIAAHILGFVRQAALGDPLVPYEARVEMRCAESRQAESGPRDRSNSCAGWDAR